MTPSIECSLAENALDYLLLAGEQAKDGSPRMVKHALATLADGIELLLKSRIEIYDWRQFFSNPSQADRGRFQQGDFYSVSFDQAVTRLEQLCGYTFDPGAKAIVDSIRQLRNRIRHFAVSTNATTANSLITRTLAFGIDFVSAEIEPTHGTVLETELAQLRSMLSDFEAFVADRMAEIQPAMDSQRFCPFIDCPTCLQRCLYADGEAAHCLFCGYQRSGEEAAADWELRFGRFLSPKDRLVSPIIESCPECGAESCLDMAAETDGDVRYVCLTCGESGDYCHCSECGQLSSAENPGDMCDYCWSDLMRRND